MHYPPDTRKFRQIHELFFVYLAWRTLTISSMTILVPNLPKDKLEMTLKKLLCLGNPGIGKTAIIRALCDPKSELDGTGDSSSTTVDFFALSIRKTPTLIQRFCFFDTGGSEELSHIRADLLPDAEGVVLFYSDKQSFLSLESRWLIEAKDTLNKVPFILCGIQPTAVPERQAASWASSKKMAHATASVADTAPLLKALCDAYPIR